MLLLLFFFFFCFLKQTDVQVYLGIWNQSFPLKDEFGKGNMYDLNAKKGLFSWNMKVSTKSIIKKLFRGTIGWFYCIYFLFLLKQLATVLSEEVHIRILRNTVLYICHAQCE